MLSCVGFDSWWEGVGRNPIEQGEIRNLLALRS
jgi:hypothetical protein